MDYTQISIIKRDGKREDFSISKIKNAIGKAFSATGIQDEQQLIADVTMSVISQFTNPTITVEEIQDLVEKELMKNIPEKLVPIAHHWLILHGRYVCQARTPKCDTCGLQMMCKYFCNTYKVTKEEPKAKNK